jgi:broad specificity phosphatase PhoE
VDDGGLTELGERQADALRAALPLGSSEALVTSPHRRAVDTAAVLRDEFEVVEALAEFVFGPAAPDTEELMTERADLTLWRADHGFPGGETLGEFQARVAETMERLVADHLGAAGVAVTHSGFVDAALRWAYGVSPEDDWVTEAVVQNAAITEIEHWPSGRHERGAPRFSVIHRVGDVSHLPPELVTEI